jgi:cysteine desulfurase family protein (TIGR01976 family)
MSGAGDGTTDGTGVLKVDQIRAQFPALGGGAPDGGREVVFFDGPGGTQTPVPVIEAMAGALGAPLSNRGAATPGERNAERLVAGARAAMADLLGADPRGIVFGRSATQLAYDFSRALAKDWSPGDEVVVTRLDHDSNIRPWVQAAEQAGATVRWAGFDPESGELTADHVRKAVSPRTRLVALTAASNLIGTRPPIAEIAAAVREAAPDALVYVDGVHRTAHGLVDLRELGADFYACSPYKFLGPHLGVLAADPGLLERVRPDKLLPSSDAVPERFELGTLPYELLAGTRAAVDFLADLVPSSGSRRERLARSLAAVERQEDVLRGQLESGLAALAERGAVLRSRAAERTPTLLVSLPGGAEQEAAAYRFLGERGIQAPAGSFYALEASRCLGLGDTGGLRIGLAPYNDEEDVRLLLAALEEFLGQR